MKHHETASRWAVRYSLPVSVVEALIFVESGDDPWAVRFEPTWKWYLSIDNWARRVKISLPTERACQQMSWGLMQIMGTVARELGWTGSIPAILDPETNVMLGCRKLWELRERWGTIERALAAYNAGSPKSRVGQAYAKKVMARAEIVVARGSTA